MNFSKILDKMNNILTVNELRSSRFILEEFEKYVYSSLKINSNDIRTYKQYLSYNMVKFLSSRSITIENEDHLIDLIKKLSLSYIESNSDLTNVKNYITLNEYFKDKDKIVNHFTNFKNIMSSQK